MQFRKHSPVSKVTITFLMIVVDQFIKTLALQKRLPFLGGVFNNTSCNPYISWGIPLHGITLWIFLILAITFLIYFIVKYSFSYPFVFILAGAIGNLMDRFQHNCVTDFISINLPLFGTFPTFNLADVFITIGTFLLLSQLLFGHKQSL